MRRRKLILSFFLVILVVSALSVFVQVIEVEGQVSDNEGEYTGIVWDPSAQTYIKGITQNGTYFWVRGGMSDDDRTYRYYMNGTYIDYFDHTAEHSSIGGLTQNGTYFWFTESSNERIYRYYINGTYIDYFSLTEPNTGGYGITQNGTYIWVADRSTALPGIGGVYRYYMNGTYVDYWNVTASNPNNVEPQAITNDGTYFWISDYEDPMVYRYYMNGTYDGYWNTASGEDCDGITHDGTYFWLTEQTFPEEEKVYKYFMAGYETKTFYPVAPSSYYEGSVWSQTQASYDTAWSTPINCYDDYLDFGQYQLIDDTYRVMRAMVRFDTSSLPDRCTIIDATLGLWFKEDYTEVDVLLQIQDWTGASDGITNTDFTQNGTVIYDDGNFNTSSLVIGQYNDIVFSNFTIISKTGHTDLFLRTNKDISKTAPIYAGDGSEWVRAYAENGRPLDRLPKLVVKYVEGSNAAPVIGQFESDSANQFNNEPFLVNCTIVDTDGIADFVEVRYTLNYSLILRWERPSTYSEYEDPNSACTVNSGSKTEVNSTSYRISWNITLGDNYPEGYTDVLDTTIVYDEITNATGSYDNLFLYGVREWLAAESWMITLASKTWFTAENWLLEIASKGFVTAENWLIFVGERVLISVKQVGLMLLVAGLGCVFLPIAIIAHKRPKPEDTVKLIMVILVGFGLLLAVAFI